MIIAAYCLNYININKWTQNKIILDLQPLEAYNVNIFYKKTFIHLLDYLDQTKIPS